MIARQTFESYPIFGDNATKVMPDNGGSKYSNGFQQSDVLPAEWMNWAWNKNTKGITDLNEGAGSMEDELINVLSEAGISPSGSATNQVYKAVRKNCGCIMASSRTITDAPSIDSNNIVKIMFTENITASDTSTPMTITYNGTGYPVKATRDGGNLVDVKAHTINGSTKYLQKNTIIEFVFDGTNLIVIGNPIVLSGDGYKVYANGKVGDEEVGTIKIKATNDVPYGWLECSAQSLLRTDYPELFNKFNTQTYDGTHTLLSRYGYADSTHFSLPDYRETALIGAGRNAKDSATMITHDVFTTGEFKDDQVLNHTHSGPANNSFMAWNNPRGEYAYSGDGAQYYLGSNTGTVDSSYRTGDINRVKSKGVNFLIKVLY